MIPLIYDNGITREMTAEEIAELENPVEQIEMLKMELAATDYKAIKYAEGWLTDDEYTPIRAARQAMRDKINELESKMEV